MRHLLALAALITALAGALHAEERRSPGTMTLYGPDGERHDYPMSVFFFALYAPEAASHRHGRSQVHRLSIVLYGSPTPDPFLMAWMAHPGEKRRLTATVDSQTTAPIVYDLQDATGSFTVGASPGGGAKSIELEAGHLTIDGLAVY